MARTRSIVLLFLLFLATLLTIGCARMPREGSAPGGQIGYAKGVLTVGYGTDLPQTYEATVKALTDLGMTIRNSDKQEYVAAISATRPDDMEQVTITLNAGRHGATAAQIKVGENGDEGYSRVVAKSINHRLKG